MEMDKAKIILPLAVVLLSSCGRNLNFSWERYDIDGHRTGVSASTADDLPQTMGEMTQDGYRSPNGNMYDASTSVYAVARDMLDVQPRMAGLKQVLAQSSAEMVRRGPNCEISNWIVDHLREDVARLCGRNVDVALINSGGIRVDMPKGDVLVDDIVSMFPFKNYLSYVALEGRDLLALFEQMAGKAGVQPFSGAKLVLDGSRIDTLLVGGKPIDPDKVYGVGTIDFLLDGGDKLNVAANAKELIITDCLVMDSMLSYVRSYAEQGRPIEYFTDDRLVIKKGGADEK